MTFRPKTFDDIVGQKGVIKALNISIRSAKVRNAAFPHCLISAGAGLGKSTICMAIANELGVKLKTVLGSNIHSFKDILPTVMGMREHEVLFIDEVHRVNPRIAESFYTILEDSRVDIQKGKDDEVISINLPQFTIVGATTEAGTLPKPLRDRFKLHFTLQLYDTATLEILIRNNSKDLSVSLDDSAVSWLAQISRGTPRIANAGLEWVRDWGVAKNLSRLTAKDMREAMDLRGIGADGSTEEDRRYLEFLKKQSGPVGINTISSSLGIDRCTIEEVIEPFLLSRQLIQKTSKGRICTAT
jgi:Holliday junction DNA helicase RuvB